MYHSSTQKSHWLFSSRQHLTRARTETNAHFCHKYSEAAISKECQFLTPSEEEILCLYYMKKLYKFCDLFTPPVPRSLLGTASAYFKRFYLYTSVMDYHPKDIFLCCAYLAFKIEEYNVTLDEFVYVLSPELRQNVADIVLTNELLMLKKLKFHLTVHSPFRPLEGFLIDMKTRSNISNPDQLRKEADTFLLNSLYTDVALLFPPSQIALAALHFAANSNGVDISNYIKKQLLDSPEKGSKLFYIIESICGIIRTVQIPESSREISHIVQRLDQCSRTVLQPSKINKRKSDDIVADQNYGTFKKIKEELQELTGIDQIQ